MFVRLPSNKMARQFKIGDIVNVGSTNGSKGRVIDIIKPLGTYEMYKVMSFLDGKVTEAAKHELVKGLPDSEFETLSGSATATCTFEEHIQGLEGVFNDDFWEDNQDCNIPVYDNFAKIHPSQSKSTTESTLTDPVISPELSATASKPQYLPTSCIPTKSGGKKTKRKSTNVKSASTAPKRFVPMSEDDINDFVTEAENPKTKAKTEAHIRLLTDFLEQKGISTSLIDIPADELDRHLTAFFITVRQKNGSEYEPVTLRSMMSSFERYLRQNRYGKSIISDIVFDGARNALKSKQKTLKKDGYGNAPKTADVIEDHEIEYLFEKGQLGTKTPQTMINTLWLNNTLHFGMRAGAEEHRNLKWGDVTLHYDHSLQLEYLLLDKERQTKTRTGEDIRVKRKGGKPAMFAEPGKSPEQCPVYLYKQYADKRPVSALHPDSPFYLACNTIRSRPLLPTEHWFLNAPIGVNKINSLLKNMASYADLPSLANKRLTNTSLRKHVCQTLLNNNIPDSVAVHVTGHKNPATLNNYRQLNNEQKYKMSHMLANSKSTENAVAKTKETGATVTQIQSEVQSSQVTNSKINETLHTLFSGSTINGGTFNIAINFPK